MDPAANTSSDMINALSTLGKTLNIAAIYGMNHPSVTAPLQEAHTALSAALATEKKVTIGLFKETLTINDKLVTDYTVHLRALERKFVAMNIPHLVFRHGISLDELAGLAGALCASGAQPGKTIQNALDEVGLEHIEADDVEYVAQHEGERIVGEDGEGSGADGDGTGPADEPPQIQIDQIVAFLKGDTASDTPPADDLQELLSDPEKLAQLIMESVSVRQSLQSIDGGDSLANIVVGCLRRTYEGLAQQRKYKSSRGKASLNKAMLLLEKSVIDKLRASGSGGDEEQILAALRDAEETRKNNILSARFTEQHKKLSKTEVEVLNYIREHGEEKARALFGTDTIPEQDWNRLMIRSRLENSPAAAGGSGAGIDMEALAVVLDKLETIMNIGNTPPEIVQTTLQDVRDESAAVSNQFEKRIDKVELDVEQHEADAARSPEQRTGTRSRADILLEISQLSLKLAQPLTVVTASIESALSSVTDPDLVRDLLQMADESGKRMTELMQRLTELVGYPSMQQADVGIDV